MISDATIIKFSNENIRTVADQIARTYYAARQAIDIWNTDVITIPNDTSIVNDGSPNDGRTSIAGQDVNSLLSLMQTYLALLENNNKAVLDLVLKISPNPR